MSDLRVAVRTAVVKILEDGLNDPYAPYGPYPYGPFEVVAISYRPTRQPIRLPAVTIYDSGVRADDVVPLYERTLHVDVWTTDLDEAERIAHLVNQMLDHQPLPLPGGEGQVAFLMLQSDQDQPQNDADLVRKMLIYRLLMFEYNGPSSPSGDV